MDQFHSDNNLFGGRGFSLHSENGDANGDMGSNLPSSVISNSLLGNSGGDRFAELSLDANLFQSSSFQGTFSIENDPLDGASMPCSVCMIGKATLACPKCPEQPLFCLSCEKVHFDSHRDHVLLPCRLSRDPHLTHMDARVMTCGHKITGNFYFCDSCLAVLCHDCTRNHEGHNIVMEIVSPLVANMPPLPNMPPNHDEMIALVNMNISESYKHLNKLYAIREQLEEQRAAILLDVGQKHKDIDKDFSALVNHIVELKKLAHLEIDNNAAKVVVPVQLAMKEMSTQINTAERDIEIVNNLLQNGGRVFDSMKSSQAILNQLKMTNDMNLDRSDFMTKYAMSVNKDNVAAWKWANNNLTFLSNSFGGRNNPSPNSFQAMGPRGMPPMPSTNAGPMKFKGNVSNANNNNNMNGNMYNVGPMDVPPPPPPPSLLSMVGSSSTPSSSMASAPIGAIATGTSPSTLVPSALAASSAAPSNATQSTLNHVNNIPSMNMSLMTNNNNISNINNNTSANNNNTSNTNFVRGPGFLGEGKGLGMGQLQNPAGVAVYIPKKEDSNEILVFVSDYNNHRIQVFDGLSGVYLRSLGFGKGTSPGQLQNPSGIAIYVPTSSDKAVLAYVADYNNHRVQIFNAMTGAILQSIGGGKGTRQGQLQHPYGICLHSPPDGEGQRLLFVAEYDNHRVQVFDAISGAYLRTFGGRGNAPHHLQCPAGVSTYVQPDGQVILYVSDSANHRIQVYNDSNGAYLGSIGSGRGAGLGQLKNPIGSSIFVSPFGEAYLIVAEYDNHRVQIFNAISGRPVKIVGTGQGSNIGQMRGPWSIALAPCFLPYSQLSDHQLMFVSEFGNNHRIQVFLVQFN